MEKYIVNKLHGVFIKGEQILNNQEIVEAICYSNEALKSLNLETSKLDINIFEALGMRNLSGLVGEYFAKSVQKHSNGKLASNLHQDGYPDLLLVDSPIKKAYYESLYTKKDGRLYPSCKDVFSPFKYGGIEVKATCGSTPPASKISKPLIGEQRISLLNSFDWKAHHRQTNNLLGILWDFINEVPAIVGCFYCGNLSLNHWGSIVKPKDGGGRTTSVSIMTSEGVKEMCSGWIAVIDRDEYKNKLAHKKWIGYIAK